MELQLTFDDPSLVSTDPKPDRVFVTFRDANLFVTEDGLVNIQPNYLVTGDL